MSDAPAAGWSLLYVADPMCSWCWGFSASLDALRRARPDLPLQLVMGGLRVDGEPLDARLREFLAHHWQEVAARSGQAFDLRGLEREGWTYTTEPACRAVVTARAADASKALPMLHAVQRAFYAEARDTTDAGVLADVAASVGLDRAAFESSFASPTMRDAAAADFLFAQRLGVRGFPMLAAVRDGRGEVVSPGWTPPDELLRRVESVVGPSGD